MGWQLGRPRPLHRDLGHPISTRMVLLPHVVCGTANTSETSRWSRWRSRVAMIKYDVFVIDAIVFPQMPTYGTHLNIAVEFTMSNASATFSRRSSKNARAAAISVSMMSTDGKNKTLGRGFGQTRLRGQVCLHCHELVAAFRRGRGARHLKCCQTQRRHL